MGSSFSDEENTREKCLEPLGVSPELKKLMITPLKESELQEMKRVLQTTIELTRAALERGIIKQSRSAHDVELLQLDIMENAFNKFCRKKRSNSLSDLMGGLVLEG